MLNHPLGLLDDDLRDRDMPARLLVEGARDDLDRRVGVALEVGDFLRALVDEQHDDIGVRIVLLDRLRHLLEQHRLARAGRRDDQRPLAFTDRRDQVDDPRLDDIGLGLEDEPLLGVQRGQVLEVHEVVDRARIAPVHGLDAQQREIPLALLGRADRAADRHPATQPEPADLAGRDINIVRTRQVRLLGRSQEPEPVGHRLQRALAVHDAHARGAGLEHLEDQVLLGRVLEVLEPLGLRDLEQLVELHALQLADRELVALVERALFRGDLLELRRLALELLVAGQHGVVVAGVISTTTAAAATTAGRALALLALAAPTRGRLARAAARATV